jgi:hypothetical protein
LWYAKVADAMLKMVQLDIAALEKAYRPVGEKGNARPLKRRLSAGVSRRV